MTATIPERRLETARAFIQQIAVERLAVETYVRCELAHAVELWLNNPGSQSAYARLQSAYADHLALEEILKEREKAASR